jgi:serine protease Do
MGIGFAIPIRLARRISDSIVSEGKVVRGFLGVTIQNLDEGLARSFGRSDARGALVAQVSPGSPAQKGGLQDGDIVLELDGKTVADVEDLRNRVAATRPGTEVHLVVFRDGEEKDVSVELGELPGRSAPKRGKSEIVESAAGMVVRTMTSELARRYGIDEASPGVVVVRVEPLGPADKAKIRHGDVILSVAGKRVRSEQELLSALGEADLASGVRLKIRRSGQNSYVLLRVPR